MVPQKCTGLANKIVSTLRNIKLFSAVRLGKQFQILSTVQMMGVNDLVGLQPLSSWLKVLSVAYRPVTACHVTGDCAELLR